MTHSPRMAEPPFETSSPVSKALALCSTPHCLLGLKVRSWSAACKRPDPADLSPLSPASLPQGHSHSLTGALTHSFIYN